MWPLRIKPRVFPVWFFVSSCIWHSVCVHLTHSEVCWPFVSKTFSLKEEACLSVSNNDLELKGRLVYDHIDPDDKMGFTTVDNVEGYFNVEGCADDFDWLIAIKNRPEVWRITHRFSHIFLKNSAFRHSKHQW